MTTLAKDGWLYKVHGQVKQFKACSGELSVQNGLLLCGSHIASNPTFYVDRNVPVSNLLNKQSHYFQQCSLTTHGKSWAYLYIQRCQLLTYSLLFLLCQNIKTSGSKSRPRKVELASAHKKHDDYHEYFTHNNEACKNPYKQPYCIDIFIS